MTQPASISPDRSRLRAVALALTNLAVTLFCALFALRVALRESVRSLITQFSGDAAIWVNIHEFLNRGHVLYRDVWDHKDAGFFVLSHPFFARMNIEGLYLFGLVFALVFAGGVFFAARSFASTTVAACVATLATIVYTSSQSFFPTNPEHASIALAVLGAGLAATYPLITGFALILSCSIKLSGATIYLCVASVYAARAILTRRSSPLAAHQLTLFIIGSVAAVAFFTTISHATVSWRDWLEVIAFNREYAERRSPPFKIRDLIDLFGANCPQQVRLPLYALGASLVILTPLAIFRARTTQSAPTTTPTLFSLACALGAYIALMLQYPPSPQHWQYLIGALVFCSATCLTSVFNHLPLKPIREVVVLLICGFYLSQQWRLISPTSFETVWSEIRSSTQTRAAFPTTLAKLPANSTVAIFGGNQERLDLREAPASLTLACRFFYQFELFSPRFSADIDTCLDRKPRFVFLHRPHTPDVTSAARARLAADYTDCEIVDRNFVIYAAEADACALLREDSGALNQQALESSVRQVNARDERA